MVDVELSLPSVIVEQEPNVRSFVDSIEFLALHSYCAIGLLGVCAVLERV
jgi:hypothetical protein